MTDMDNLVQLKLKSQDEYDKYMKAFKEVILDIKKIMEEL